MENRCNLAFELVYGVALLTAIATPPDILMKLRLNDLNGFTVSISYPEIWDTTIWALLLTALAMLPTLARLPNFLARSRFFNFLLLAPWILLCCLKFLVHVGMHVFAMRHVAQFNNSTGLIMALAIYCIIFGMATEIMFHWIAIAHMSRAGYYLDIRRS